jgi:hypothetical protein
MTEWYSPDRKPPAARTQRAIGELPWEIHVNHIFWRAELFDEQAYGFVVRLFRGGDFFGLDGGRIARPRPRGRMTSAATLRKAGPNEYDAGSHRFGRSAVR